MSADGSRLNPYDSKMLRRACDAALDANDLCPCPMQVFRLARRVLPFVNVLDECTCMMCNAIMASRVMIAVAEHPDLVADFHQPGASALYGPGEKRDELLIGPTC